MPTVDIARGAALDLATGFDVTGLPVGFIVVDTAGQAWQLMVSAAAVDATHLAVKGISGLRWLQFTGGGGGTSTEWHDQQAVLAAAFKATLTRQFRPDLSTVGNLYVGAGTGTVARSVTKDGGPLEFKTTTGGAGTAKWGTVAPPSAVAVSSQRNKAWYMACRVKLIGPNAAGTTAFPLFLTGTTVGAGASVGMGSIGTGGGGSATKIVLQLYDGVTPDPTPTTIDIDTANYVDLAMYFDPAASTPTVFAAVNGVVGLQKTSLTRLANVVGCPGMLLDNAGAVNYEMDVLDTFMATEPPT